MSNPTPILNNINAFDATKGTTISFNIIGGTDIVRSNIVYIYDLSTNDLICTHLYISTESIHELPPNTDPSIVYASGKSSADFVNNKNYYLQIQTFTNTAGTAGGSGMSVAKTFWCLFDPALSVNAIPAAISTTSYNVGATYTTNITDATIPVTNIIQQYKFDLYTATGTLVQTSGNIIGSGEQEGTSTTYNITYNFSGLVVNNSYYVVVTTTSTEGMTVSAQSNTFTVSIDTPTVGGAIVNNNACDGYISVVSNLSDEYGGHVSGEMASFETDSVNNVSSLKVNMEPIQEGSGTPSPTNIRPIRGHSGVNVYVSPTQSADDGTKYSQEFDVSLTPTSTDKVPYTFKAVGRDVYGDRESDKIVGGTVAWNQLIPDDQIHKLGNMIFAAGTAITAGHKYLVLFDAVPKTAGDTSSAYLYMRQNGQALISGYVLVNNTTKKATVYNATASGIADGNANSDNGIWIYPSSLNANTFDSTYCNFIDLTALFNPTIADYIYSLEQATAGAGVAWFRRYFPEDYYPYDPGSLRSVEGVSAHETVGFNQFDEDTVLDSLGFTEQSDGSWYKSSLADLNGALLWENKADYSGNICVTYDYKYANGAGGSGIRFKYIYEDGSAYTDYPTLQTSFTNRVFSSAAGSYHGKVVAIGFDFGTAVNATWLKNVCVNYSWEGERDGEYEPYVKHTYPLDSSLTLRGVPKLVDGKLAFDGDVYPPSGEVQRRYGIVDLGTLNWADGFGGFYTSGLYNVAKPPTDYYSPNAVCSKYHWVVSGSGNTGFFVHASASYSGFVIVVDPAYTDAATFKTAMSGVMLVYELTTPTTETAEPFTNPQVVDNWGTEAYVTTGIVPVGHDSEYLTRDIFSGTLDLVTGVLTVDRAMVDLGTLNWADYNASIAGTPHTIFATLGIGNLIKHDREGEITVMCNKYQGVGNVTSNSAAWARGDKTCCALIGNDGRLYVRDDTFDGYTREQVKSALSGVYLVYELATPQTYQLTPHQIQTLVGQNNVWSDAGGVDVTFNLPISNLLVKRQDASDVSGNWLTLYSQPITQASDMDFTYIDFLNQHGKTYRYALVPLLTQQQGDIDVEIEGGYTVSDDILSVFDGVFVANSNGSQKLKAATEYGDLETNQDVGVLTTIGGKYPFVVSNSNLNYHSGSISALIVPSDFYTSGDLDRLSIVERREAIEQFLTDKTAKVLKDWNGNIWLITFVENVEVSFVDDYGMGLGTLSAKWVEIGDVNDQTDLKQTGLI